MASDLSELMDKLRASVESLDKYAKKFYIKPPQEPEKEPEHVEEDAGS